MLTLQRLGGGQSLEAIVKETLTHHRDIFPDNKRVREGTLSRNSSADSETRHRLPIEVVERFTDSVARTIIDSCPDTLKESSRCRLVWKPSAKDRKTNPALPRDARVTVELHAVQLENGEWLNLVTSLDLESEQAARLYARRYDVKHDIRDLKVSLGVENTRAQSDEMVRREMLCSMVAYNLVVQLRREAAKVARLPPRRLSFTGVWNTMQSCLLHQSQCDASTWQERYATALSLAAKDKLPQRPGRSYPRRAHPQRPKSTKFMKLQTQNPNTTTDTPPPTNKVDAIELAPLRYLPAFGFSTGCYDSSSRFSLVTSSSTSRSANRTSASCGIVWMPGNSKIGRASCRERV